jgi:hypothetical protein
MSLAYFREDLTKQQEGAPIHVGAITFYCKRWGTPESQEFLRNLNKKLFGPFHKAQDSDQQVIYAEWLTGYGVVNWEGCRDVENGMLISYSPESAREIFTNPEYYMSLNVLIINGSMNFENYLHDEAYQDLEDLKKK